MNANLRPTDRSAILAVIDPDVTTASTVVSGWLSMALWNQIKCTVLAGTLGTNATVDAKIQEATDASGTGAKDITGKAITQMTQAGTDQSDTQAIINLEADELDAANDFTHVQFSITVGTATSDIAGVVEGFDPRYGPASNNDAASVGEIVN